MHFATTATVNLILVIFIVLTSSLSLYSTIQALFNTVILSKLSQLKILSQ